MVKISAFKSLRPVQKLVAKVTTQPYSNYSQDQIEKELKDEKSFSLNIPLCLGIQHENGNI